MKTLSHPVRLAILCDLIHHGEMGAGDIVAAHKSRAGQSQVSQYLTGLRKLGYVKARKEGKAVFYEIASPLVESIIGMLYREFCGGDLSNVCRSDTAAPDGGAKASRLRPRR